MPEGKLKCDGENYPYYSNQYQGCSGIGSVGYSDENKCSNQNGNNASDCAYYMPCVFAISGGDDSVSYPRIEYEKNKKYYPDQ